MMPLSSQQVMSTQAPQTPAVTRRPEPALQTDGVSVVYTTFEETLRAARIGATLAARMNVPLRVVHFRTVPRQIEVDAPNGLSPVETEAFAARLLEEGIQAGVRVYLCRDEIRTIPYAFKPHSIVVMGGHHSFWPTRIERWRHALEAAGHFVMLVGDAKKKETSRA